MKLALALLTLFSCLTAAADEIDDRARRNAERQAEESRQQTAAYRAKGNSERLIAFNGFVNNHGGLQSGTCRVATEDCSRRYGRESTYCPLNRGEQTDIRSLGASGEYVIMECRVVTGDGSACELGPDSDRNSAADHKANFYKATCTPEGGAPYLLTFNSAGKEYRAAPIKEPKPEKETYSSRTYSSPYGYYGHPYGRFGGYYGYGRAYGYGYGSRVYNCYGEQCNYYGVGKAKKSRRTKNKDN